MTDAPKTAEINDAVFCLDHFKEVVRPDIRYRSKLLRLIIIIPDFCFVFACNPCVTVRQLRRRPAGGK
jgi:hypothetical protein